VVFWISLPYLMWYTLSLISYVLQFSKLDMDRMTYSLVFGESMLNDAVSIVSFKTLGSFYTHAFSAATFFRAVGMFLLIFTGATLIGLLMAALVSLILRRSEIGRSHPPMEITFVVGGAYLAYFVSDFAHLSGIVSIFFYGIASRHYTYYTLTEESQNGSHWAFEYALRPSCSSQIRASLSVSLGPPHRSFRGALTSCFILLCSPLTGPSRKWLRCSFSFSSGSPSFRTLSNTTFS
jgi:hypothetical protein